MSGTRQKTLGKQLSQTLVAEGRGEALDAEAEDAEPLMAKPAPESPALAEQLMEEVCDRGNLERAWKRVRSNKGSPGVDGMTIDAAKDYLREPWPNIRAQLLLSAAAGQTGRNPEAGRRDQKARRALRRRQADSAGYAASSPSAVGPDVFRAQLRLSTGALRPSGSGSGATLRRRGLQRRGRSRSRKVFRPSQSRQPDGAGRRASVRQARAQTHP